MTLETVPRDQPLYNKSDGVIWDDIRNCPERPTTLKISLIVLHRMTLETVPRDQPLLHKSDGVI